MQGCNRPCPESEADWKSEAGSRLWGPEPILVGPGLGLSAHTLHAMCSALGLEVIKLMILKATSLMSAVMKSDTFTGTPICKAVSTTRGPARETNGGREKHINTM